MMRCRNRNALLHHGPSWPWNMYESIAMVALQQNESMNSSELVVCHWPSPMPHQWWGYRNHPLFDNSSTSLVTWVCLTNFEQTGHRAGTSSSGLWNHAFFHMFSLFRVAMAMGISQHTTDSEPRIALVPPQELREARKREEQYQELLTLGFP